MQDDGGEVRSLSQAYGGQDPAEPSAAGPQPPRWLPWLALAVGLYLIVIVFGDLRRLDRDLGRLAGAGYGIVALELAFTPERAERILDAWGGSSMAGESVRLDFVFIAGYVLVLGALCLLFLSSFETHRGRGWALAALPLVAGAFDGVENAGMMLLLSPRDGPPSSWLTALVSGAASAKLLLLIAVAVAVVVLAVVSMREVHSHRLLYHRLPQKPATLSVVTAAERRYLERRRRLLGIAEDGEPGGPPATLGLAFSGGGIRSAITGLGVLQGLWRVGLLHRFDYLSSVSGGGYIAAALSSLLSVERSRLASSARGELRQYAFGPESAAYFETRGPRFPFASEPGNWPGAEVFDGRAQVEHLRTHGDFLIRRKRLIHRDVLRAVGSVVGGVFYHLLLFLLFLGMTSSLYLLLVHLMAGDLEKEHFFTLLVRGETAAAFGEYTRGLFHLGPDHELLRHPFLLSMAAGGLVLWIGMLVVRWLVSSLDPDRFRTGGESMEETRDLLSLWALLVITLITAAAATYRFVDHRGPGLPALALPMVVYAGGALLMLAAHAWVALLPRFTRNDRSRIAAWAGMFYYLVALAMGVLLVPFLLFWLLHQTLSFQLGGVAAWAASVAGARWLVARVVAGRDRMVGILGRPGRVAIATTWLRNLLLSTVMVGAVALGWLLFACGLLILEGDASPLGFRWRAFLAFAAAFVALGMALDFNKLSLHLFYRDRLVEAFLQSRGRCPEPAGPDSLEIRRDSAELPLTHLHGVAEALWDDGEDGLRGWLRRILPRRKGPPPKVPPAAEIPAVTGAPYHLLVASLNLTRSRDMTRRSRRSDYFIFSKLFCGSRTTGFLDTRHYRGGRTRLARAMTVSGAAMSSAMGARTFFAQAAAMTLFNARLGQWLENPAYRNGAVAWRRENLVFWPKYLLKEMLGSTDANNRLIHVSDGGHSGDNLGLGVLLQRRCRLIVAVDAETDPRGSFTSLAEALRQAQIDDGVEVDLSLEALRPDPATGRSKRHFAVGCITYHRDEEGRSLAEPQGGWLVVLKASLTGDEPETVKNYAGSHPDFPHQTTADQFFDDAQFESYRTLGVHIVERTFGTGAPSGPLAAIAEGEGYDWPAWEEALAGFHREQAAE